MNDRFKYRYYYEGSMCNVVFADFVNPYVNILCNGEIIYLGREETKLENLMQCTGLRDKEGKLVYEKDILLSPDNDEPYMVIVEWGNEKGYIVKAWNGKEFEYALSDDTLESLKYFQIIGNEFENPELLEERHE